MDLESLTESFISHMAVRKQFHLNRWLNKTPYKLLWKRNVEKKGHTENKAKYVEWIELAEDGQPL
jgi:hypothetical protein